MGRGLSLICLGLALVGPASGRAQDADGAGAPAPADPAPAPADPAPAADPEPAEAPKALPSLLILPIRPAAGVEEDTTKILDDLAAVHMEKHKDHLDVTAYDDVKQVLDLQGEKHGLGCDEASCLADLAGALGARYIVTGRLGKLGSNYILTMSLFDSDEADSVARGKASADDLGRIGDKIPAILDQLVGPLGVVTAAPPATTEPVSTPPAQAETPPAEADPPASKRPRPAPLPPPDPPTEGGFNWLAIGGGAAGLCAGCGLMAAGTCFDLTNWGCSGCLPGAAGGNGALDAMDFIGPGICAVGLVPCVAGLGALGFSYSPGEEPAPRRERDRDRRDDEEAVR